MVYIDYGGIRRITDFRSTFHTTLWIFFLQCERSHRTIRNRMRYDILESQKDGPDYNWVLKCPVYQIIYNTGYHKSIGD